MGHRGLLGINTFLIPMQLIRMTVDSLSPVGAEGREAFVVWGGVMSEDGGQFSFHTVYRPQQNSIASEEGLLVLVDAESMFRMNKEFYERGMIAAAQVHTHPTEAFHSNVDDHFPLVTLVGGLSAVIPDFAQGGVDDLDRWAWFRLMKRGQWNRVVDPKMLVFLE